MKKVFKVIQKFCYRVTEDYVVIHGAYSTMFLFMSIFPLIMFLLNLLPLFRLDTEYLLSQVRKVIPSSFYGLVESIVESVAESSSGLILSVSVVMAVWTASSGIYGILVGLNDVYRTYDMRNMLQKRAIAIFYTFIFVVIVISSLVLLVFGQRISLFLEEKFPRIGGVLDIIHALKYQILFVILVLFFALMYKALPYVKNRYIEQLPGALFAAALWLLFSYVFSLFVNMSLTTSIYGSLTLLVFFLVWIWGECIIIFMGGEINAMIRDHRHGEDLPEIRLMDERRIKEAEKRLRADHRLTAMERFNLRKTTTRQVEMRRLLDEMQEELDAAEKERRDKEERENPSGYSNS